MGTNTFKLIDEIEWAGQEIAKMVACVPDDTDRIPFLIASIRRSLIRVEKMIEEKENN